MRCKTCSEFVAKHASETLRNRSPAAARTARLGGLDVLSDAIDRAARNLLRLRERVDTGRLGEPRKLLIVTGTGYGYERPDGVSVAPLAALGP